MVDAAKAQRDSRSSYPTTFIRWLQLKKYQYEVTFSLYMLTSTEKFVFNSILFILISLLVTAAFFYLPNHVSIIYHRVWYYISGEFVTANGNGMGSDIGAKVSDTLKTAKEVVVSQTLNSMASNTIKKAAQRATGSVLKDEL